jgi:hypothetical protein
LAVRLQPRDIYRPLLFCSAGRLRLNRSQTGGARKADLGGSVLRASIEQGVLQSIDVGV